jgi:K+-transporting ATPase ATPase F chain
LRFALPAPPLSIKGRAALLTLPFIYGASGLCAVLLFAYLGYALIRAEKF